MSEVEHLFLFEPFICVPFLLTLIYILFYADT